MPNQFDYFVVYAGMRTGSNFLEASLNEYPEIQCFGEIFNPHFIGNPKNREMFGVDLRHREADPMELVSKMKEQADGLPGFRFFFDHDPRVLDISLADPRCAKIFLTRNLLDTYVSREIARETDQWRLGDLKNARSAQIKFDRGDYLAHVTQNRAFQDQLNTALRTSGQTAFHIRYQDLPDVDVLNGLARFLGASGSNKKASSKTKKQNPSGLRDKVENFAEMERDLARIFSESLLSDSNFEMPRGPAIPSYITAAKSPLLFLPILSGPVDRISRWLNDLDGVAVDKTRPAFTQKSLRRWKRQSKGHRSFTVIRHPVPRLYDAFVRRILLSGEESYPRIRELLVEGFGLSLPKPEQIQNKDVDAYRQAFLTFTEFVKGNLNGQTSIRTDAAWASQSEIIRGMGGFIPPDFVFREQDLDNDLKFLATQIGQESPRLPDEIDISPVGLTEIYDDEVEMAVRACYQRDYMMFGFGRWKS